MASSPEKQVIRVVPQGYCQGVIKAIQIAQQTVEAYPNTPIYMLGMLVHNEYVVGAFQDLGVHIVEQSNQTRLSLLEQVPDHSVILFTAHGVSDEVLQRAKQKNLIIVDATCKDVQATHTLVKEAFLQGKEVLFLGKKHHPEAEGIVSLSSHIHLIETKQDLDSLPSYPAPLITTQTTMSSLEVKDLLESCLQKYPDATVSPEICQATRIRQEAIQKLPDVDCLIVVGDPHSNNTKQLCTIGIASGIPHVQQVKDVQDLTESSIAPYKKIAVTSGSSTPSFLTNQVIETISNYQSTGKWVLPSSTKGPIL